MSAITPLADELDDFYAALLAGRSAITRWRFFDDPRVYSKVGGDLSGYDPKAKAQALAAALGGEAHGRLRRLLRKAPFSTGLALLVAAKAWQDAGLPWEDPTLQAEADRLAVLVGGHNLNEHYLLRNHAVFQQEPDFIDALAALLMLDTDHAASVGELLGARGACYTVGGACASANVGLRAAIDEIRHHGHRRAVLVGSPLEYSPMGLHAMGLLGAISIHAFHDEPHRASRPYDRAREGFVPTHGAAALVLESLAEARSRGARIWGEVLGCVAMSDGSHLPSPSQEGQARTMRRLLEVTNTPPEAVDFVSAHATSTPQGDLSELRAIREVFGAHAARLHINAPKSMLGHTCWSAPAVETVAGLLQLRGGRLHPTINLEDPDPEVDLDVCAGGPVDRAAQVMLKNSFGFGGLNCCALWRRWDA